jgi:hypothetical protein
MRAQTYRESREVGKSEKLFLPWNRAVSEKLAERATGLRGLGA